MPPATKITKEMILACGYELVKTNGIENINARNIAKSLGCSTQPIYSQFPNMEELKQSIHDLACENFEQDVRNGDPSVSFLRSSYLKLVNLAKTQDKVFQLIFLSKYCKGEDFFHARMTFESNKKIWNELKVTYQLDEKQCSDIMERISLLVHGIATLIATSNMQYTEEQIISIVENTLEDIVAGMNERRLAT